MKKKVTIILLSLCIIIAIAIFIKSSISNMEINQNSNIEEIQSGEVQKNNGQIENINQSLNNANQSEKENKVHYIEGKKQVGKLEISDIKIELIEEEKSRLTATVKNTSKDFLEPTNLSVKVINEKGETEKVFGGIVTELIWDEVNTFTTYVLADITDAYDIEFEIIENSAN